MLSFAIVDKSCKEPVSSLIQTLLSVMESHHISHLIAALCAIKKRVADFTAGRESHPAPKICYFVYMDYYSTEKLENQGVFGIFLNMWHRVIFPISLKSITPWSFPNCCVLIIRNQLRIEQFHAHCLRHTHGTILAENGVNPKTVMERLGHRDIATTLGTYTFNTESMQTSAVDIFETAVNT